MQSIETCSVPNERKIKKQEEARKARRKKLEKQTIGHVRVETILKQKNVLKWHRPQQKYNLVRKRRLDNLWFGVPLGSNAIIRLAV
jgi:hypothetical protein